MKRESVTFPGVFCLWCKVSWHLERLYWEHPVCGFCQVTRRVTLVRPECCAIFLVCLLRIELQVQDAENALPEVQLHRYPLKVPCLNQNLCLYGWQVWWHWEYQLCMIEMKCILVADGWKALQRIPGSAASPWAALRLLFWTRTLARSTPLTAGI